MKINSYWGIIILFLAILVYLSVFLIGRTVDEPVLDPSPTPSASMVQQAPQPARSTPRPTQPPAPAVIQIEGESTIHVIQATPEPTEKPKEEPTPTPTTEPTATPTVTPSPTPCVILILIPCVS